MYQSLCSIPIYQTLLLVGAVIVTGHWLWTVYRTYCWRHRLPGPSMPLPFFLGHVVHIAFGGGLDPSLLHQALYVMLRNFGFPKLGRIWLGPREIVVITDPEAFRRMLGSKYKMFDRSDVEFDIAFVRGGLITARNGQRWRQDRRMLAHHFDHASLTNHMRTVLDRTNAAVRAIDASMLASSQTVLHSLVDLKVLFFRLTFDVICQITFGTHFRSLESTSLRDPDPPMLAAFEKCLNTANVRFYMFWFPYWKVPGMSLLVNGIREYDAAEKRILDAVTAQIRSTEAALDRESATSVERKVRGAKGATDPPGTAGARAVDDDTANKHCADGGSAATTNGSTLEYFLRKRREGEIDMDDDDLRRHLVTFLFAGHDTTVRTAGFGTMFATRARACVCACVRACTHACVCTCVTRADWRWVAG